MADCVVESPAASAEVESPKLPTLPTMDETCVPELDSSSSATPEINKEKLKDQVHLMKREDIENLIVDKIIESIKMHSSVSALHKQLMEALAHKDKLFNRVNNLHRQVTELTKAVRSMSENVGRQKTNGKNVQPIRFYRSVGLQVTYDSPLKPLNEKINSDSFDQSKRSVLKQGNHHINHQIPAAFANNFNAALTAAQLIGQKRPKPVVSVADVTKQVQLENQNKMRKLANSNSDIIELNGTPNSTRSSTANNIIMNNNDNASKLSVVVTNSVKQQQQQPNNSNSSSRLGTTTAPEQNNKRNSGGGGDPGMIVDLTDDNDKDTFFSPIANSNQNNSAVGNTVNVVNVGGQQQQVMLVRSAEGNIQFVTPLANQPRPLQIVNNRPRGPNQQQQPIVVRSGVVQQQGLPNSIILTNGPNGNQYVVKQVPSQNATQNVRIPSAIGNNINIPNSANALVRPQVQNVMRPGLRSVVADGGRKFVLPPLPPPSIIGNPRRCAKDIPPRPELTLTEQKEGIVLSWTLKVTQNHSEIQTYQIYACQEPLVPSAAAKATSWKKVGDVKALPLPMACTLSQFADENRYHFIVRGVDVYNRTGPFCEVMAITLKKKLQ